MTIYEELEALRKENNGLIRPKDVLEAAKNPDSALHARFNWDDTSAANSWRLEQARELIRVFVQVTKTRGGDKETRLYVALSSDKLDGGGYRVMSQILSDDDMRRVLLSDAFEDLERLRVKYELLQELAGVFREVDKVKLQSRSGLAASARVGRGKVSQ